MSYTRKVQYYETDKMGIVHHSNYIRWFEEARVEYMLKNGIDYNQVELSGLMMPVLGVECKYIQGAKYSETVSIDTNIAFYNGVKLIFEYTVKNSEGNVLVTGNSTHCFVNTDFKPVNIKKADKELNSKIDSLKQEC